MTCFIKSLLVMKFVSGFNYIVVKTLITIWDSCLSSQIAQWVEHSPNQQNIESGSTFFTSYDV